MLSKTVPKNCGSKSIYVGNIVKRLTASQVYNILHRLMAEARLLGSKVGRRYAMRPHSIRKFFRTQMAPLGVQTDYIEYKDPNGFKSTGHTNSGRYFLSEFFLPLGIMN
jgi:hypothetical protein